MDLALKNLLSESLVEGRHTRSELLQPLCPRKLTEARHIRVCGCANQLKDHLQLVDIAVASQYWSSIQHLAENATRKDQPGFPVVLNDTYPTPHRSIAVVYFRRCINSSGGRYHRVTTSVV